PEPAEKVRQVYGSERAAVAAVNDADASLYDGFLAEGDKRLLAQVRASAPDELGALEARFRDPRLIELLFRYRARNWPQTLSFEEQERWNVYRRQRLLEDRGLGEVTLEQYHAQIADLRRTHPDDATKQALLDQLAAWGSDLQRTL
ncbi:exodeoxyribonuclease I, partial [Xanthomonas perforans]|nr:exodeoxyribonuclease I [Xanthomonas perforans]